MLFLFLGLGILQTLQINGLLALSEDEPDLNSIISEEQLPGEIVPTNYVLDLQPKQEDAYFKGRVTIDISWQEDSNKIVLHADPDLVIYQTELVLLEDETPSRTVRLLRSERDPEHSWYIIHLRRSLSAGTQGQLSMTFTGKLNTETYAGLYLSTSENPDEDKYFIASQFKPTFARRVFPCFDEPRHKTSFKVSIVRKTHMSALSNMPVERSEVLSFDPTYTRDYFQESFPMATHNLGILISEFTSISLEDDSESGKDFDIPIQAWGSPETVESIQNSTQGILKTLGSVGDYLGMPYSLPKLDIIGGIFNSNNWGLISLSYPVDSQLVYSIISQWIGNLVSPGLWSDEIISDGLRCFLTAYIILQDSDNAEIILEQLLPTLHSISYVNYEDLEFKPLTNIPTSEDAMKIAMVLRMLNCTLGEAVVKQGLQRFISETKYKTYQGSDIWNAITEQAHSEGALRDDISVESIANSWISTSSYPVLTVKRNYRDNSATFTQHSQSSDNENDNSDHKWIIPIVVIKEDNLDFSNTVPLNWLEEESLRLPKMGSRDRFIIVNPEELAPFSVNYDERNWKLLSEFLKKEEGREKIPPITRSKLLDDALNLAHRGELSYKTALDMILFLINEDKAVVWKRFFVGAEYIQRYLGESSAISNKFLQFLRQWIIALDDRLESENENPDELLKMAVDRMLCELGYKPCIEAAKTSLEKWTDADTSYCDTVDVETNICYLFLWGSDDDFEFGLQHVMDYLANNKNDSFIQSSIISHVITCIDQSWKIEKVLNITIFERVDDFSDSDIDNILVQLAKEAVGYKTLLEYLIQYWEELKERFEDKEDLWKHLIETATSHFKTQEGLDLVQNFYSEKKEELGTAESVVQDALKIVEDEVERSSVNYPVIEEWLEVYLRSHEDNTEDNFFLYER